MVINDKAFNALIQSFSKLEEVEAILLGGSFSSDFQDDKSDYDLYIYIRKEIPVNIRKNIIDKYCSYAELNNQYWETEDDGILNGSSAQIDIVYRELKWIKSQLQKLLYQYKVSTGYSTCIWHNFVSSKILFDRSGKISDLQEHYTIPFPKELKKNIIAKNYPLLRQVLPAYLNQIERALGRDDMISVNHRISAFLESYFDIIFAFNELPHYGEKKILQVLKQKAKVIPENMFTDIPVLIQLGAPPNTNLLDHLNLVVDRLDQILPK